MREERHYNERVIIEEACRKCGVSRESLYERPHIEMLTIERSFV
jgi:predicted DNA-binding transcriptional regulator AlpA